MPEENVEHDWWKFHWKISECEMHVKIIFVAIVAIRNSWIGIDYIVFE